MLSILRVRSFAQLFAAQVVALLGTGLLTIALGLLAFDLADDRAGAVLGTLLTVKMIAYVGLSPFAAALVARWPAKRVLIGADLFRCAVALALPFVDTIWQVYLLIFLLQAASATFTPAFQATIPALLPEDERYTRALSLSRLAYDLESLVSPVLAGLLLTVMSFHWLFAGTGVGFALSAALVAATAFPRVAQAAARPFRDRLFRGLHIYLATPRLRGLLALTLVAAAVGGFVLVNTVVVVKSVLGGTSATVALVMAAYGGGSMVAALALPRLLDRFGDRPIMRIAAAGGLAVFAAFAGVVAVAGWPGVAGVAAVWAVLGVFYSATITPSGRLLARSAHAHDRPSVYAAQFALSHGCWLITYPTAGWIGAGFGLEAALFALVLIGSAGLVAAFRLWPPDTRNAVAHDHADLPPDHPHLRQYGAAGAHRHVLVIDDVHNRWPG